MLWEGLDGEYGSGPLKVMGWGGGGGGGEIYGKTVQLGKLSLHLMI